MVVGDNTLHISRDIVPNFRDVVRSRNGETGSLVRCLCVAEKSHAPKADPLRSSSKDYLFEFAKVHQDCTPDSLVAQRGILDLQLFYASRQTHQDASFLFWRTTQFCFIDGEPLTDFLICITEFQEQNLRYLIIFIAVRNLYAGYCRRWIETYWPACNAKRSELYSLRHLAGLELHLQIRSQNKLPTHKARAECIQECFDAVGDLCLLPLKTGEVGIRYAETVKGEGRFIKSRVTTPGNLERVAQKLRKRLLQPASAQQPFADSLTAKIKKLEMSLQDFGRTAKAVTQTAVSLNKLIVGAELWPIEGSPERHESHFKAMAVEERIGRLKAELYKNTHN